MKRVRRDDEGSIILTVMVMLVTTGLIVSMVALTDTGLRSSRRAGDSANALQVADAGVNDAVKRASTQPPTVTSFSDSRDLPGAGNYKFTATKDPFLSVWHIDAVGTDPTGVKRHVRASAVEIPVFTNALFGTTGMTLHAGVAVDSYKNHSQTCTGKGFVGTNDPSKFGQGGNGGGNGVVNCQGTAWGYPYDGCIAYADQEPVPDIPPQANCPPSAIFKQVPKFPVPKIFAPAGVSFVKQPPEYCDGAGNSIPAGTYYWQSVQLRGGCQVAGDVKIFTTGSVAIGNPSGGQGGDVNYPTTTHCPNGAGENMPYCPKWPGRLQIYTIEGSAGSVCYQGNQLRFWGVIMAGNRIFDKCPGAVGSSHLTWWGAGIFNDISTTAQFWLHYDESLASLLTGRYVLRNWREEPL